MGGVQGAVPRLFAPGPGIHASLEKGRSAAEKRPPVGVAPESVVLATLPHLSPQVAAMVGLQRLTAARPGEICTVCLRDVDRSDDACWVYRPVSHKTEHHGKERVIPIGPRAGEVLRPWLDRDLDAYGFSPAETIADRLSRSSPTSKAARPKPDGCYTVNGDREGLRPGVSAPGTGEEPREEADGRATGRPALLKEGPSVDPHRLRYAQATGSFHLIL